MKRIIRSAIRSAAACRLAVLAMTAAAVPAGALGADWSVTELHYQYGKLEAPMFAGGEKASTHIVTFQHASGWTYGDNFFFVDFLSDSNTDGFNDSGFYGEWYSSLSLSKIRGREIGFGPVRDVGIIALAFNADADANVRKYLPGIRLSWDVPGFAFLNTDVMAYIDFSEGVDSGGAPEEDNSFIVDINGAFPFELGRHRFSIEGHVEYVGKRENEFGDDVSWWVLAQPQLRYDLGNTLWGSPDQLFVGVEWQVWLNKLGDEDTDENTLQALAVWRF